MSEANRELLRKTAEELGQVRYYVKGLLKPGYVRKRGLTTIMHCMVCDQIKGAAHSPHCIVGHAEAYMKEIGA